MEEKVTKYERARIIGARALQLAMGAPVLLKLKKAEYQALHFSPINIAKKEFEAGVLPLSIRKKMPRKA